METWRHETQRRESHWMIIRDLTAADRAQWAPRSGPAILSSMKANSRQRSPTPPSPACSIRIPIPRIGRRRQRRADRRGAMRGPRPWLVDQEVLLSRKTCSWPAGARKGAGRALIEAVCALADARDTAASIGSPTKPNATARSLYDQLATRSGFIHTTGANDAPPIQHYRHEDDARCADHSRKQHGGPRHMLKRGDRNEAARSTSA